ncbi:hypothetical protein [Phaeobacter sp. J2-8]|uniref:hypothetical protein n=1 Tax=Phaeobacter sp. J2-8 TaxID=2931394 RepID=UPI001FD16A79|nr:hypothetical protein [Phaeobacter sp. J2-8]MCJ7871683.1 hypothetical protein [Phaeobacter sp. J2-8]
MNEIRGVIGEQEAFRKRIRVLGFVEVYVWHLFLPVLVSAMACYLLFFSAPIESSGNDCISSSVQVSDGEQEAAGILHRAF